MSCGEARASAGGATLLTAFPDLQALRSRIAAGWRWPTVLLHCQVSGVMRNRVKGPLSIFVNLRGRSENAVGWHPKRLEGGDFMVSNAGEEFTLRYREPTETLNVHFNDAWVATLWKSMQSRRWDTPESGEVVPVIPSAIYRRSPALEAGLQALLGALRAPQPSPLTVEEALTATGIALLRMRDDCELSSERLGLRTPAARAEVLRRLLHARDYLHACWSEDPDLDQIARQASLSRFHFLRLFRQWTGMTPAQYKSRLQLEEAHRLIHDCGWTVVRAARHLGFSEPSALSRAYRRTFGSYPSNRAAPTLKPPALVE